MISTPEHDPVLFSQLENCCAAVGGGKRILFNRITPDGEPADDEEELSPADVQAAVENWRDQILAAISQPDQPPYAPWPENNERPYYTDKPDWDAFGAMLLVAACRTYEEPVPSTVEKDWIFGEHPLVARLASDEERVWSLFRGVTWWLPLSDSFLFQGPVPTDDSRYRHLGRTAEGAGKAEPAGVAGR